MPNQKNLPTEEELAVLAANGDDESMALLISAVTPIAKAKAISFATVGISDEDLLQEGMLGFLDAVRSFDPSKEIRFRTFAETCIHNRIVSAVRNALLSRTRREPVYAAGSSLSLAAALVSLYQLLSAIAARYGDEGGFARVMGIALGACITALIAGMAVHMIRRSTAKLRAYQ